MIDIDYSIIDLSIKFKDKIYILIKNTFNKLFNLGRRTGELFVRYG